jgi:hypothetical protein
MVLVLVPIFSHVRTNVCYDKGGFAVLAIECFTSRSLLVLLLCLVPMPRLSTHPDGTPLPRVVLSRFATEGDERLIHTDDQVAPARESAQHHGD